MAGTPGAIVVGVDVGGTAISAGAVTVDGAVIVERREPTPRVGAPAVIERLVAAVQGQAAAQGLGVAGLGVGVPGPVDTVAGRIGHHVPHVPELAGRALAEELGTRFRLPAFVDNDVNALALGEWMFGVGRDARSLVVLAPGTGFGGGIVLDGTLLRGAAGFGGELGHTPVKFDGPRCWCGGRGCLAVYASGRGIAEAARARRAGEGTREEITATQVFAAAAAGDPVASSVIEDACQALGAMLGTVVNGLNPEMVVITGGVAGSLAHYEPRILRAAGEYAFAGALAGTRIRIVPGDKRTSMRGAAALALYELERLEAR